MRSGVWAAPLRGLLYWGVSRFGVLLVSSLGLGILLMGGNMPPFLERWGRWDALLLIEIAQHGYAGNPLEKPDPGLPAFFPGMPLALRAVHLFIPDWVAAGLLISLVAGAVAMMALARLGEWEGPRGTGSRAVFALLIAPPAVFLFAGYSEALFLAFAVPAWLAARQGRWWLAGLLAAGASTVRITGLFLAIALIVEYGFALWRSRRSRSAPSASTGWRDAPWLLVPFLPLVAYSAYLHSWTGDWLAWKTAQEKGWDRELVWPWQSWETTWHSAFMVDNEFTWSFRMELIAAVLGVLFVLWLLITSVVGAIDRRAGEQRWGELVYVGLQVGALIVSEYYLSIPRSAVLWFPLWLALGRAGTRRPWVLAGYALIAAPLMAANVLTFVQGRWAG